MSGKLRLKKSWSEHTKTLTSWAGKKGSLLTIVFGMIAICSPILSPGGLGLSSGSSSTKKTTKQLSENKTEEITIADGSGKTVWDWLSLLGVPTVLVFVGSRFQKAQQEQSERLSEEQREQDADEAREEVLQRYFDRISTLLVDKNLMAIAIKGDNIDPDQKELLDVSIDIIKARTLSILRRFGKDSERKSSVIRFLAETNIISPLRIDLSGTNLSITNLSGANLHGANLRGANLGSVARSYRS